MSYKQEYERWLHSDALSPAEHAELESIAHDERRSRTAFTARWSSAPPVCGAP